MRTAIVTTTIRRPTVLARYLDNAARFGHSDVEVIVVGDRKTPAEVGQYLRDLAGSTGYVIDYWDVERQRRHLTGWAALDRLLPYDSIQRRNLGYLVAAEGGHERIISIDDDNWPTDRDFLGGHSLVGTEVDVTAVTASNGWFNSAALLDVSPPKPLYHRGFPTSRRAADTVLTYSPVHGRVVVNAGLWLGVPDADAMSHLDAPVTVTGLRPGVPTRLAVAPGTNLVFNTQNTAFHRDLLTCMFLPPMGDQIGDLTVGRYDDIWMSILVKMIADYLGDLVCVGEPLSEQVRNEHDLFADALVELPAQRLTNRLVDTLAGVIITGGDYATCYAALVADLRSAVAGYPLDEARFMTRLLDRMSAWGEVVRRASL